MFDFEKLMNVLFKTLIGVFFSHVLEKANKKFDELASKYFLSKPYDFLGILTIFRVQTELLLDLQQS